MTNDLLIQRAEGVLTITFNRPDKKNALTYDMYRSLFQQLQQAADDNEVRVVVFTGAGDIFSAGNDIKSFQTGANIPYQEKPSFQFMNALATFNKPVIGAVNGDAIGIGATLLFHCDLLYCAEGATIKMPFMSLGVVPEFASSLLLPLLAGHSKAFEIFALQESISAQEALAIHWVNAILPAAQLLPYVEECAAKLAARPPVALQATKRLMKQRLWEMLPQVLDNEAATFAERLRSPEVQAIFAAFLDKRR